MDNSIIKTRLAHYTIHTLEDEENALKEIIQEIALYALSTTDFFQHAQFQGGTALRILYQLPRFSEDLDFILNTTNPDFKWKNYISAIEKTFLLYGITPEVKDRSKVSQPIQRLFLKDDSIGKTLNLSFQSSNQKKLLIKLEIDTNPPQHSRAARKYLDFPIDHAITCQDLPSNFAGKCHALLCRPYEKGRDWFDLLWYLSQRVTVNLAFLESALHQHGPWKGENLKLNVAWLQNALSEKIKQINWDQARQEVQRFLGTAHRTSLDLWEKDFFLEKIKMISD